LLATEHTEAILRAAGFAWHMPTAVQSEVQYVRQYDPAQAGQVVQVPADLSTLISNGVLIPCSPQGQSETDRYVHYAAVFRSDGEAMCLAIAEQRSWTIATDDRKAITVAKKVGLVVVSSPELLKSWADTENPDQATLTQALQNIQVLAQFRPSSTMPENKWWNAQTGKTGP
jgi:hypothetical protein